ncbi:MAG: AzlD domain-containing protein [Lachnospiraceae bacterium]|nr:AzlD domain-containing protein [Lachnospiraceae bacterium]
MSGEMRVWAVILVIAAVTAAIRFAPFVLFGGRRGTPLLLERLGKILPSAVMGMLVVYCLKDTQISQPGSILPAAAACLVTGALYVWRRNSLLSIVGGTVCYMFLVQVVFA